MAWSSGPGYQFFRMNQKNSGFLFHHGEVKGIRMQYAGTHMGKMRSWVWGLPLRSNLQGLRNWDVPAIDEWEVTPALLAGNILSLLSLRGYFSSASCFCLPILMPESDDGGSGCSGQVIGPNSWDFPSTSCASNKRCGLRTTEESRASIRKWAKQKHMCKESHKANRTHYEILEK